MKLLIPFILLLTTFPALAQSEWDGSAPEVSDLPPIEVYRSPDCQCCHRWIEHLQQHHLKVIDHPVEQMAEVKEKLGVPMPLESCHSAVIDGYVIEGHVPADDIIRLITEKPDLKGLAVPQMPVGTPGMEVGQRKDDFAVIGFDAKRHYTLYNRYQVGSDHLYHSLPAQE